MKNNKLLTGGLCLTMVAALLTGCGNSAPTKEKDTVSSTETAESTETATSTDSEYPLVVEHYFGETVIEQKPERIATIGWENQDTPLALGVIPVGVSAANYGKVTDDNLHLWTAEAYEALGETNPVVFDDLDGYDYEAIHNSNPDVILAAYSGLTEEEYALLSEIAPVIPYKTAAWQTYWRDQTIQNATGMGMKKEGEAKVAEVNALIHEKLSAYPELAGTKTAFFWISPEDFATFYVYLPNDPRANYLTDLGLEFPESVLTLAESTEDFSVTLSRENADLLNDVEMMVVYGDEQLLADLQADELMSQIPAIRDGAVVLVDSESVLAGACTPSILSIPYTIDEYLSLLNQAREKIPS